MKMLVWTENIQLKRKDLYELKSIVETEMR